MSSYEDYSRTSLNYDQTRAAVGMEIINGCLLDAGLVLPQSRILDAGCGSGNYSEALLPRVGSVVGVDLNAGMLEQAKSKLAVEITTGHVELLEGDLTHLPLPSSSVDGAVMNQVLHHLPDTRRQGWPLRRQVFSELARVIRPGGVFILNACTPTQIHNSWWYCALIPQAFERMIERHLQAQEIRQLLRVEVFEIEQEKSVYVNEVVTHIIEAYRDNGRALDKPDWRVINLINGTFDLVTGELHQHSPEWFFTGRIELSLDENITECPEIDKLFSDWVDEKDIISLYEMVAYSLVDTYKYQKYFFLIGRDRKSVV